MLGIAKAHDHSVTFVLILIALLMKREWNKMGSLRREENILKRKSIFKHLKHFKEESNSNF